MGRNAQFSDESLLAAAAQLAAAAGASAVTIAAVAAASGAPTGSIYHRFSSRDVLLGRLWLDTVERFQAGFCKALDADDALGAALHTPRWVCADPTGARVLLLHRARDFHADHWPAELQGRAADQQERLKRSLRGYAARCWGRNAAAMTPTLRFAVIDVPYAAVRRYVEAGETLPIQIEGLIRAAYAAVTAGAGRKARREVLDEE